jgi:hypothetical protein
MKNPERIALTMKRFIGCILALLLSLTFTGCTAGTASTLPAPNVSNPKPDLPADYAPPPAMPDIGPSSNSTLTPGIKRSTESTEYPVIDGSTSTITMHAAIRAHLTGE